MRITNDKNPMAEEQAKIDNLTKKYIGLDGGCRKASMSQHYVKIDGE